MTKICLVTPFVPPYGGMALQGHRFLEMMNRWGYEVFPVRVNRDPGQRRLVHRVPIIRTAVNTARFLRDLVAAVRRCDVVVVFSAFFDYFFWVTYPTILVADTFGKALVLSARGGGAGEFCRRYRRVLKPLMRRVDVVFAPSPFLAEVFESQFDLEAAVVPSVVDTGRFFFRPRVPLKPALLAARNLESIYGLDVILRAFRLIWEKYPEASLTIAGNGSQARSLKDLAKALGLEQAVTFLGSVPHERMPELFDTHDIFVNASRIDNLPNALLEAFASGLPVVTTNAGGIPYLVEHGRTGVLVDVDDWEGLGRAVMDLLENPEKAKQLIWNAREEVKRYTEEAVRSQVVKVLEKALGRNAQRQRKKLGFF